MARKVVITGLGATTPHRRRRRPRCGRNPLEGRLRAPIRSKHEWVAKFDLPVTFAARGHEPSGRGARPASSQADGPSTQFAVVAAREAWKDSGIEEVDHDRLAVAFATGIGGVWTLLDAWDTLRDRRGRAASADDGADADAQRSRGRREHGPRAPAPVRTPRCLGLRFRHRGHSSMGVELHPCTARPTW